MTLGEIAQLHNCAVADKGSIDEYYREPFKNRKAPEAIPLILKAIQIVVSGLLRLKLQIKCELFSK